MPDRGFASIGYGVPGGIGAQIGVGAGRKVVSLTGDGGFNMSMGDLETARRVGANFTTIIFNNAASGYVKALQHAVFGEGNYQSSDLGRDGLFADSQGLRLPWHSGHRSGTTQFRACRSAGKHR